MVVHPRYILCDRVLSAPFGLFPDDDRYHADAAEYVELVDADRIRSRYRCTNYADCMAGKLQRGEYREVIEQDADLREMV